MGAMGQNIERENRGEKRTAFGFVNNRILFRRCYMIGIFFLMSYKIDKFPLYVNIEKENVFGDETG